MNEPGDPLVRSGEAPLSTSSDGAATTATAEASRGGPPPSARDWLVRFGLASRPPAPGVAEGDVERPTFLFFGIVAGASLLADVITKAWAEVVLSKRLQQMESGIVLIKDHLTLTLAYNKGGAWGLLADASETIRRPFFFAVSVLAVLFIVSLYSKLVKGQHSLTWGLPFVLGGALGNLSDRVTRSGVIDFIDYRADWVLAMNQGLAKGLKVIGSGWGLTDHWPTFNIADVAICIGVGLMAVDMFTSRRGPERREPPPLAPVGASNPPLGPPLG
jgi:signal peptidase II